MTYGDGLSDVDFIKLLNFHNSYKKIAIVTVVSASKVWSLN